MISASMPDQKVGVPDRAPDRAVSQIALSSVRRSRTKLWVSRIAIYEIAKRPDSYLPLSRQRRWPHYQSMSEIQPTAPLEQSGKVKNSESIRDQKVGVPDRAGDPCSKHF